MRKVVAQLMNKSHSERELVLTYQDAIPALVELEAVGAVPLGWEGWLLYLNGQVGHSKYQGTISSDALEKSAAYSLIRETMQEAEAEFRLQPERPGATLLFCIALR